jgi:hypothetical protein
MEPAVCGCQVGILSSIESGFDPGQVDGCQHVAVSKTNISMLTKVMVLSW